MELKLDLLNKKNIDQSFWQSIKVLVTKPHVINKRVWGSTIITNKYIKQETYVCDAKLDDFKLNKLISLNEFFNDITQKLLLQIVDMETELEMLVIELLPRSTLEPHAFQLVYLNKNTKQVTFYDITPEEILHNLCPTFAYSFSLQNDAIILNSTDTSSKSYIWLRDVVLPQVKKWREDFFHPKVNICNESLALVDNIKYYTKYNELKLKYGKQMVKIWPENTDPLKFVYEDVAIATYLLLLWDNGKPQIFADIGCGNGLLVYILTMEGHTGFGVDVRKRKIWDIYPVNIKLIENTVTPSNMHIFSDVDWIIGNHSDELTPWIPVIAAKGSYKCKFFLLPCCAYNFDGSKYQRRNSSKSQYTEYLEHIKDLCEYCGFLTKMDRLKIPSTKRICLIGYSRKYCEIEHEEQINLIQDLINKNIGLEDQNGSNNVDMLKKIKTREPSEKVRNCTQVDKNIIDSIIKDVTTHLLGGCAFEQSWSRGKKVEINELVQYIAPENMKPLKSECGGLQTLLKNNHNIFEVQNGFVQIRYPRTITEVQRNYKKKNNIDLKTKVKKCWFYINHPQGCPLEGSSCSFLHEN